MLTEKEIFDIWLNNEANRTMLNRRQLYYEGNQVVPELYGVLRIDGRYKTNARTNWTRYVCDMHSGFLTTHDINYTLNDNAADKTALDNFNQVYEDNNLNACDTEHLINSLLYGYSVEVHSFDGDGINISMTNPINWTFVRDENQNIVYAIYYTLLPQYSMYQGGLLQQDKEIFYVYDDSAISLYERSGDGKSISLLSQTPHNYGTIPIAVFKTSKNMESFFNDAFLTSCDLYDIIRSSLADEIKYNVDSFLDAEGISLGSLLKVNDKGKSVLQALKEVGILAHPKDTKLGFATKNLDIEKFRYDLRVSRASIHLMGCIPDLTDTVNANGASTSISGIALKLLFQSMIQKSAEFVSYFEIGLKSRIDMINRIWSIQQKPLLVDYDIKIERNIPQNDIEWAQYSGNLKDILPIKEIYRLLPFIEDPERVFADYKESQNDVVQSAPPAIDTATMVMNPSDSNMEMQIAQRNLSSNVYS